MLRDVADSPVATTFDQACAVPFRRKNGRVQVCLITTGSGRWIFPKGFVDRGESYVTTALKEALEEAGLHGRICGEPLGCYQIVKSGNDLNVIALQMEVLQVDKVWAEAERRRRKWVSIEDASGLVTEPELLELLEQTKRRLPTD